tara:strand:- start:5275 stop:6153 length:879 start_codon:yes stop_codon:yes gene_type:complete
MKTRQLLLSILFLFTTIITFAQAQFTNTGIAVQGIARDANNTAIQNQTIALKFTFLYETGTTDVEFKVVDKSIVTDNFGVFSSIIDPGFINNEIFSNKKVFIRINNGQVLLSREPLNAVPYAISANNGVPTGAIMPFIGTVAPTGWALCNGAALPSTATELRAMVGANAPNLGGRFLKGAGAIATGSGTVDVISVRGTQVQSTAVPSHDHSSGTLTTADASVIKNPNTSATMSSSVSPDIRAFTGGGSGAWTGDRLKENTIHKHAVTGRTASTALDAEIRPNSYGVNYIIKL